MIGTDTSVENEKMKKAKEVIEKFYHQLTKGCGKENCSNPNCASNTSFKKISNNEAAILAIQLAQNKAPLCEPDMESNKKMEISNDDNDDVVTSKSSSTINLRNSSASSTKNLVQSLEEALKAVSSGTKTKLDSSSLEFINEEILTKVIQKCKDNFKKFKNPKMEIDDKENDKSDLLKSYEPLFELIKKVFTSYKSLGSSFKFDKNIKNMANSMPTAPPFNIDFNSIRRSFSTIFSINSLVDELEETFNQSIYPLCISIQIELKKQNIEEEELNEILHALLIVNEIPLLDNPGYMDKCSKVFYSTLSDLPVDASAKIVRLWSIWNTDELKIFLYRAHQYITLEVVIKNVDVPNEDDDEDTDDEENNSSVRKLIYKNEGLIGAVNYIRLIYYASILGGRLDPEEQIKNERELELEESRNLERSQNEEESIFEGSNFCYLSDPLEKYLNIRPIDCREPKIPKNEFINETINKYIDVHHDYIEYTKQMQYQDLTQKSHQTTSKTKKNYFSFLSHPYFVILKKKNLGLFYDNKIKMMRERRNNIMISLLEGRMPNPYFKIQLSRQNILREALSLIELQEQENPETLRKQLFIEFENEQGIDQGGVSKEFFQLAIDELLNKGYTFFKYDDKSRFYWFTPCTIESQQEFTLVGILFGIAIYNNVLLDVQFPPVFFRKLMGKIGTFEDLAFSHPELYKSLNSILEYDGSNEDFEDTFMLTFQISLTDNFGTTVNFNLKENGDKISVTKENRKEFVDLYADFMLNKGIEESFGAFKKGFMKLTASSPLSKWFTPEEIEALLCGTTVLDWKDLEHSTNYDSGFDDKSTYIKNFWSVFNEFSDEQKKLFLKFTTGTDRCPHGGLSELKLTIARNGPDTDKLPTAHTCFNVLLLPEYSSKQKLKEKLLKAIQYSQGFGLS